MTNTASASGNSGPVGGGGSHTLGSPTVRVHLTAVWSGGSQRGRAGVQPWTGIAIDCPGCPSTSALLLWVFRAYFAVCAGLPFSRVSLACVLVEERSRTKSCKQGSSSNLLLLHTVPAAS